VKHAFTARWQLITAHIEIRLLTHPRMHESRVLEQTRAAREQMSPCVTVQEACFRTHDTVSRKRPPRLRPYLTSTNRALWLRLAALQGFPDPWNHHRAAEAHVRARNNARKARPYLTNPYAKVPP